jgi:hypothetical protein
VRKKFDQPLNQPAHAAIYAKKEDPEKCDCHNYNPRRDENFVPRGPRNLPHLHTHFMQKTAPLAGIFRQTVEKSTYL